MCYAKSSREMIQNSFFAALFNTYTPDELEDDKITYDKKQ